MSTTKKHAVIYLRDNFADWEAAYVANYFLHHPDWELHYVSPVPEPTSLGGLRVSERGISLDFPETIDALLLIGGHSWQEDDPKLLPAVQQVIQKNGLLAAICGAVDYLARHGFLNTERHTGNDPEDWEDLPLYTNSDGFVFEQSVRDHTLVTANGTAPLEWTRDILIALDLLPEKNIEQDYLLNKLGFVDYVAQFGNPFH